MWKEVIQKILAYELISNYQKNSLPLYLILSKEPVLNLDFIIYNAMDIVLTYKNYQFTVDYKLDFDVIGKIVIYKELRI